MANRKDTSYKGKKIAYDTRGWIATERTRPPSYDLVELEDDSGRHQMGWWTGTDWDTGRRIIGAIVRWRPLREIMTRNYSYP